MVQTIIVSGPLRRGQINALRDIGHHQALNRLTGSVHAAALCDKNGNVISVREDVGRHNAFDKLIGAMASNGLSWNGGFALLTSRCSFELVEKAVIAQCPLLVTISAPTALAIDRARAAGLSLCVLARPDAILAVDQNPRDFVRENGPQAFATHQDNVQADL